MNYIEDMHAINRIIRGCETLGSGIDQLYRMASKSFPQDLPVWKVLNGLNWESDVPIFAREWSERSRTCIPPEANGIYLGIDGLNVRRKGGLELGCCSSRLKNPDKLEWTCHCEKYCDGLWIQSLADYYEWYYDEQSPGHETFGQLSCPSVDIEYIICYGVSAIVIREAFRSLPIEVVNGTASDRVFAHGFISGDLYRIGHSTPNGFVCDARCEWHPETP